MERAHVVAIVAAILRGKNTNPPVQYLREASQLVTSAEIAEAELSGLKGSISGQNPWHALHEWRVKWTAEGGEWRCDDCGVVRFEPPEDGRPVVPANGD